ncbi:T-cell-interacting, activating receptor on myeloid cells protein 1-like [Peromyscus leucopus]|uniref:T-cell-interacting, activating receptor on myeloid cells protein 1-like n=1 Tax=Peromyscus leucopus TaxID=10041 RepID=UPI0018857947|nr:T-cell-interacting, activating receptor on myeloid cells protein 1-like [Peromyscus leucopus]
MSYATEFCFLPEPPFKPILRMWPSSVVPTRGNVTLRCITSTRDVKCVIKKGGTYLDPRTTQVLTTQTSNLLVISGWTGTTEFLLTELQQSDAEYYSCECSKNEDPDAMSSDASLLLVTGHLPKPSLQSHQWSKVTAGGNVTLYCQKPDNMTEYTMFMLLKEGIPSPVQVQSSESNRADFSLHNVTATDTGNYSCVYHQKEAPFWASHPSDHFKILVSDFLPKPSLSAWPNAVASENSNMTLKCVSPMPGIRLVLRKGDKILDSRLPHHLTEGTAEFRLTNLRLSHAGHYTCEYYLKESPDKISPSSDVLILLVTGDLPKPSLRVQHLGRVTTGEVVKLQCQKPHNSTELSQMFALLKEGNSSPIQPLTSENNTAEFTLQNVTSRDAGRYSCVYLQAEAPFRTSHPSDYLDISVAMSPSALSKCYTKINLIRLGMSAMFVIFMAVFLAEAWYSQRVSPSRLRPCSSPAPP